MQSQPVLLHQRLLRDIAELQARPYPNISLHLRDEDLTTACLILTPNGSSPLHLTIHFGHRYPILPPTVTIQSKLVHPNIYRSYICASILNTDEGYTPAYTLKGISIQLLSFFGSDKVEQIESGQAVELATYRKSSTRTLLDSDFHCPQCNFGEPSRTSLTASQRINLLDKYALSPTKKLLRRNRTGRKAAREESQRKYTGMLQKFLALPQEVILLILERLDAEELIALRGCEKIRVIVTDFDLIRLRELQCFCLKKSFMEVKLGIGIQIRGGRGKGSFASEFDLLSAEAFNNLTIRKSVHGLSFSHWMPLPISRRHWNLVRKDADEALATLARAANLGYGGTKVDVLHQFMSNIVVQFSHTAEQYFGANYNQPRSSLAHASEKAIESYYALFHLLLCIAIDDKSIVEDAHRRLAEFQQGNTSKSHCPDLGHLLAALLVSEQEMTEDLTFLIIKEAVTRNVVWMFDPRGAGMADLSYLEPSAESDYRLEKTFQASKTSYRLLMFLNLFRKTARPPGKSIQQVCDEAFDAHGAPPKGTTERLANEIRNIHAVHQFPPFLKSMGITVMPSKLELTTFLRQSVKDSMRVGYSRWPLNQSQALGIRMSREPGVEATSGLVPCHALPQKAVMSFFPGRKRQ